MDNIQILNAIRTSASDEYKNRIPVATKTNLQKVSDAITTYPNAKNEFVSALTNQVSKQVYFQKFFENPFKFFKKGVLEYGKSIEGIFIDLITGKGFNENFGTSNTDVGSLISTETPNNISVEYYSENFRNKYKTTISDQQLKGAFRNANGLSQLIQGMIQAPLNSAEFDEFIMLKKVLNTLDIKEVEINNYNTMTDNAKAKLLTKIIKTYIGKFRFLSDSYNSGSVKTFSTPNELVVLVTPETQALIDVELLSSAFNMSKAEIESRLVLIDEFTKTVNTGTTQAPVLTETTDTDTIAILCDSNLIQFYETENSSESFRNPDRLETNIFYHRWGIMAGCSYVNAIKIKNKTVTQE